MTKPTLSPKAITEARSALRAHVEEQQRVLDRLDELAARLGGWADEGLVGGLEDEAVANGAMMVLRDDILAVVHALFEPAARAASPVTAAAVERGTWAEAVFAVVSPDAYLGPTVLAAAARWHVMMAQPILPRMLAALARVDQSRVHGLVREGVLQAAPTRHAVNRPGRRVKGDETRIRAASALKWLKAQGLAPEHAVLLARPRPLPRAR